MTTDNATELRAGRIRRGDLVLASASHPNNPGEVVIARIDYQAFTWNLSPDWFTRIGAVSDGWRTHTGSERPVGADGLLEWFSRHDREVFRVPASDLSWDDNVAAYRVLAPNPTHQEAEAAQVPGRATDRNDGARYDQRQGAPLAGETSPQPIDPSDLRAIADEMRNWWIGFNEIAHVPRRQLNEWANLLSREPEPLKVGDRVKDREYQGTVIAFGHDGNAAVDWSDGSSSFIRLSELQPITPEKADD